MSSLAAARADNFYYPPEWRPEYGGISKFQGSKGKNQYEQFGIIRFEMPFDGWCLKCNQHLAKGLRFNAKKDKDGKYFSTQIFKFEMKCYKCSGIIIIKTDPKNDTYDYFEGIRKMEHEYTPDDDDQVMETGVDSTVNLVNVNPISKLQTDLENKVKVLSANERLESLIDVQDSLYANDYDLNSKLRKLNREKKRKAENLIQQGKMLNVSIPVGDVTDHDRKESKLANVNKKQYKVNDQVKRLNIMNQSIFKSNHTEKVSTVESRNKSKTSLARSDTIAHLVKSGVNINSLKSTASQKSPTFEYNRTTVKPSISRNPAFITSSATKFK